MQVLGAGGMGVVFRAEDPHLQRMVALKAMLPALAESEEARERFLREARAAAKLKHDHIVTIFQVGEDRGTPFLAMEFLEGEALVDRIKRESKMPLTEIIRIGREIAEGLEAAHEHGLIHRDIKPANIWLEGKRGRVKILDFGLARSAKEDVHLTQSGAIVGTPAYMPPEQARGEKLDGRCDLYSLGCVLYRLCTGHMPFTGDTTMSLLLALATEQPKSVRELNADAPPALADLIMRLLAKDPAQRLATAREVADALGAIDVSQPVVVKAATAPAPPRRWRRLVAVAAAGALLLAALLTIIIIRLGKPEDGVVVIETVDPDVELTFTGGGRDFLVKDKKTGDEIQLPLGSYQVALKGKQGLKLETREFTVKRGDKPLVRVTWKETDGPGRQQENGASPLKTPTTYVNSIGMKMVLIPSGRFMMGSPASEKGRKDDEGPVHEVTLSKPFFLGVYEVTRGQFRSFVDDTSYKTEAEKNGKGGVGVDRATGKAGVNPNFNWRDMGWDQTDDQPVINVSWNDAAAFCAWLSRKEGKTYRLPTEAEWEYACRAGSEQAFSFGADPGLIGQFAWNKENAGLHTHPVGRLKPNPWGLYDMHGNVWEWCADYYQPYQAAPQTDPEGPATGAERIVRGGSWGYAAEVCRAANRYKEPAGNCNWNFGFRAACTAATEEGHAEAAAPVQIQEPPPLAEWLKGRTIITVSQDGKGQFKTIQAALDALKPGQVVKVLDRGPYRERLKVYGGPEDTGLISEQQTVVELSEWSEFNNTPHGHSFVSMEGFRVHGFAWIFPAVPKGGYCFQAGGLNGFVLENCLFQIKGELKEAAILHCGSDADAKPFWVRDCLFLGKLTFVPTKRSAIAVAERNYFDDTGDSQALFVRGEFTKVVIRHNVFGGRVKVHPIGVNDMKEVDALEIWNNTMISPYPLQFGFSAPRKNVTILNNLRSKPGLLSMDEGPEKELPAITENWQIGHNAYPRQLRQGDVPYLLKPQVVPQAPTDVLAEPKFLSLDPAHPDYLRIAADSPQAKGGAGGAWPSYMGALPPGPAPKDGDWFTRLRQRWSEESAK